jgi:uncharacterized protein
MVEHNGDVYPCDFFAEPELRLGNILNQEWAELEASPVRRAFGLSKRRRHAACAECRFLDLCGGDCPRHRFFGGRDPQRLSWLCTGWRLFYEHSLPAFRRLARLVQRERAQMLSEQMRRSSAGLP